MFVKTFIILLGAIIAPCAWAVGHETGHGGGGFYCLASQKNQAQVFLLDFWEAENLKKMTILKSSLPRSQQIESALDRFSLVANPSISRGVRASTKHIEMLITSGKAFLPREVGIAFPDDAKNKFVMKSADCTPVGIALYNDEFETIDIDKDYFDLLSETDAAGLIFHEAIYLELRRLFGVEDSIVARKMTACAFAAETCTELNPFYGIPASDGYKCKAEKIPSNEPSIVHIFDVGSCGPGIEQWRMQVTNIGKFVNPTLGYIEFCETSEATEIRLMSGFEGGVRRPVRMHSSDERWKNLALPLQVGFTTKKDGLYINGNRFLCERKK